VSRAVREYPHLSRIGDHAVSDSLRLLWDKVFELESSMAALPIDQGCGAKFDQVARVLRRHQTMLKQGAGFVPGSSAAQPGAGGSEGGGGGTTPSVPGVPTGAAVPHPGDQYAVIAAVDAANPGLIDQSCISAGGNWGFMDIVVNTLRASDPRWGYNCKRGNCDDPSHDAIFYYGGPGAPTNGASTGWIFDVINSLCPPGNASPSWQDQTGLGVGGFKFPR